MSAASAVAVMSVMVRTLAPGEPGRGLIVF